MQIDPAALTGTTSSSTISATKQPVAPPPVTTQKASKALISVPRLDLEPVYTELKAAISIHWTEYKEAIALFLLGHLNQNEFASRVDHFLCSDPKIEHLHNNFVCAIIGNLTRDLPDHGVASWVSANDKPTVVSKPVSGDAAEQRLKTEIKQLPPKDRRRLKALPEPDPHSVLNPLEDYHQAKQIRLPDQVPASAGGLNKTNWELEIRKRYAQPLASEIGEFPDADSIYARMVPICYEESVVNGASFPCAVFMSIATENFVKEFLSTVFARTRLNGPSGTINGTMTRKYRRQLEREEMAFTRGELVKHTTSGFLPVEAREANTRQALGVPDLRLALELGGGLLGHMPLVVDEILGGYVEEELEAERQDYMESINDAGNLNGVDGYSDDMDIDESGWEWDGATSKDRAQLGSLLDDCLSMAA
ncbi:transcriptional coactivator HFI1/ADA1 [[Emmonsia] crescens]|uniref:Transcriptional coactivator HFI1/ADA1 n=1 Tax=[Emmonsia] crescens TaxID=73230 RepID=A0A2B7ZT72_9EURO|nr:transcriptional coactivator HFI1/ADA1 [Emmonsia crescens]